ncbi:MAG: uridine diphosphate-N-acetylglucosamine-binding protein YvcK [Clostridia bacterium]|nr:uridine diphosphate-N-acetylglucosamine-binding protein YvcK [Clostridia bacterium]
MKGFFSWFFISGNKIKRWLLLIILSMVSICYAISTIIVTNTLDIGTIIKIVVLFVIGFLGIVVGWTSLQKRNLEMLIKKTDKRVNVKSLIYDKKVYDQGPKIVVIGGGNGLNAVLRGLKEYTDNITAIVTVSDYGDKNADSRMLLDTLPLEDVKESLVALSSNEEEMNKLINFKFQYGSLKSLTFGDVYLLAMQNLNNEFSRSIEKSSEILNITGKVLPVTQEEIEICAELTDGTIVKGRGEIPDVINEKMESINRVFISPSNVKVAPGVEQAIKDADAIIIGPGSLYTNVIPNLLVKGVSKAIKESKGFKIYISNIMTEPGQTYNYSLSDHIKAIKRHIGEGSIDYCIYDTGEVMPEFIRKYNMKGSELVDQDIQKAKAEGVKIIKRDLATIENNHIRHDPDAIARSIIELICEDLKFNDKQNDPQYLMLNQKLKFKKVNSPKKEKWKKPKLDKNGKSKFYSKYEDRIISLRESNEKIKKDMVTYQKSNQILEKVNGMKKYNSELKKRKQQEENEKKKFLDSLK